MTHSNLETNELSHDYDVHLRVLVFGVVSIALILMSIYFIRSYAARKQIVIQNMHIEASNLENAFSNDINYSQYFVNLLNSQIQDHYKDLNYIQKTLQNYVQSSKFNTVFGWRKYSWIDSNFKEVVTSTNGIEDLPKESVFIKKILLEEAWKDSIIFFTSKTPFKNNSLKLISSIEDKSTGEYIGSVVLSYDIATMIRRLYASAMNNYTNFIILDNKLKVVVQSKMNIKNIIDSNESLSNYLTDVLKRIDFAEDFTKEFLYLDMLSGVNYYIKKIPNLPFILVTSLDSEQIRNTILSTIVRKIFEVLVFGFFFFVSIISIYKREKSLRAKAEQATKIANKATKAKSDFLAFTAHEIRSPLGFILTGSEIMTKKLFGEIPDAYIEYADGIHQNSKMILDFITDILDENQIIEGNFKIINAITKFENILEQAIAINKTRFNKRTVEIHTDIQSNLPKLICDQRRILQVLNNVISNAIKYSNDDTTINIKAYIVMDKLEIEIADQGIGMSDTEIHIALSTYGVVLKENHNFIESYGLGLPIVKMLLDAHDATLIIKSKPKIGTVIKIIFPKYKLVYNTQI